MSRYIVPPLLYLDGVDDMRPMFHFTERRIETQVCICFVAYKVYKELELIHFAKRTVYRFSSF